MYIQWLRQSCLLLILIIVGEAVFGYDIGSVDTKFNLLSPDDSVKVAAVKDVKIDGIVCYLSRAQKGGYSGMLGLAEDTSDASIDCRQVGPITVKSTLKSGESIFRERRSLIFKSLKIVRFCDIDHNTIVYLAYSERVIEGSPKNSVSAVPIRLWPGQSEPVAVCRYKG